MGQTHMQRKLAEKKDALRVFIKGQNYIDAINRDLERDIGESELPVVRFKTETRLALLKKVIPDLKTIENNINGTISIVEGLRELDGAV
jgi:hypothetical protein